MGEAEGKKDEADYKRLQTFPLVRVSPGKGGGVPPGPTQPEPVGGSSQGPCWHGAGDTGVGSRQ